MRQAPEQIPDEYLFSVCEKFLGDEAASATEIAQWLSREGFSFISREKIYPLIREGIAMGYVKLCPPEEVALGRRLATLYPQAAADIQVVNVRGQATADLIALVAAEKALTLIRELGKKKSPVHIGLGAGKTSERVCRALAKLLRFQTDEELPEIVFHALSAGFDPNNPVTTPVSFFSFFTALGKPRFRYIGLFSAAAVQCENYESVKQLPGVREAFAEASCVDIVLTSIASSDDPDGQFNKLLALGPATGLEELNEAGWVGDVQWRPYNLTEPIITSRGIRSVTLFELEDLVELSKLPGKHVILISGPCWQPGKNKSSALRPLLESPSLRVFNHLILDISTANDLLVA